MRRIFLLLLIILFYSNGYSQIFIIGDKSYPSTEDFELKANSSFGENLKISFAKKESGGMIILKTRIMGGDEDWCKLRIKGNIIIYLDNGKVIKCTDRNIRDRVDDTTTSVYYLTDKEINELKNSNVNTIRYSIKTIPDSCSSSEEGDFSASNLDEKYGDKRIDIPTKLSEKFI